MQTRGTVAILYDNVDKTISAVIDGTIKELDYPFKKYVQTKTSTKKFERVGNIVLFGDVPEKGEGEDFTTELIRQGYTKDFTHVEYGLGFKVTPTALEDDQYDQLIKAAQWLGFSARYTEAKNGANILNNGFTATTGTLTPDGLPLFYATHTLGGGGTARNKLSTDADLSMTSLTTALSDVQTQTKLDSGQLGLPVISWNLVVHPDNEFLAHRLTASAGLPETADNDVNPVKALRNVTVVVDPLLTDSDAWFLIAKDKARHGLVMYERVAINTLPVYRDAADNRLYRVRYRESFGADDWRNSFGSSGA